jgi:hypothetical protein
VAFNPALLAITGAVAASGLPVGSTIGFITKALADGCTQATITVRSPTAIPAGAAPLADLVASVPATAASGATEVLSLAIVSVNGVAQALPETSGLRVVGSLTYGGADGAPILRVVGGADSGFAAWSGIAPGGIADLNGVTVGDAAPVGGVTLVTNSATPFVSAPTSLRAAVGGVVTVPVTLDRGVVMTSGTIALNFDPAALMLTAVRADPSSGLTVTAGPASGGTVSVSVSHASGAVSGVLALFDFQVASSVPPGGNIAVDLSAVTLDGRALALPSGADGRVAVAPPVVSMTVVSNAGIAGAEPAVGPTRAAQAALLGGEAA